MNNKSSVRIEQCKSLYIAHSKEISSGIADSGSVQQVFYPQCRKHQIANMSGIADKTLYGRLLTFPTYSE